MSSDIRMAVELIVKAGNTISKERPGVHGHAENSFTMIGDLWTAYLKHVFAVREGEIQVEPHDVARMMELLKIARSTYGSPNNRDNFIDSIGYAALAGMMQLPDRPFDDNVNKEIEDAEKSVREYGGTRPS